MVNVTIDDGVLGVEMLGVDKLWTLRSHIDIPLENVQAIRRDPDRVRRWWSGLRAPGTWIPGVIKAGTFHKDGKSVFFDVHDPANTVIIELADERFSELVLEVDDPDLVVTTVGAALGASTAMAAKPSVSVAN
jgi:hypothetical protein